MVRVLSADDVSALLDLEALLPVVEDAFAAQYAGTVERPERPHYSIGIGRGKSPETPQGTGLCMPAYIHGSPYAATKLATVFEGNPERGLPTVSAQIALTDADTGEPVAYLDGTTVTSARTGCIGGLAARTLALEEPVTLGVIGAGTQARWQTRAIAAATPLERVRIYSPSNSREACAADLEETLDPSVTVSAVSSPTAALEDTTVIVTATPSTEPVFDGDDLEPGALVIAVGAYTESMRELDDRTIDRAALVYADVPDEARETGDLRGHGGLEIHPFGGLFVTDSDVPGSGDDPRCAPNDVIVLSSVGSAVLDAATATHFHERAVDAGYGGVIDL
ncbi:ornithine cyclodeaminase family protein [Natronosalvus vescus]|uniref:ornithine cyclodeaminase family protein n=1 Tax=Natronosalvus vescus TaxID=2953881 RepID=UPI0020902BC3|nr:ornithine cyclodeaminase family protein [Natronosalvus vescus]